MLRILRSIEWTLLILLGIHFLMMYFAPILNSSSFNDDIREAKKQGSYFEGSPETQTYYGKKLRVNGVIYGADGDLRVIMTGTGMLPNKLPNRVQVQTDSGAMLDQRGSSSSNNALRSEGDYLFSSVPQGIRSVRIFNEAYGESFSFTIPLSGGGR